MESSISIWNAVRNILSFDENSSIYIAALVTIFTILYYVSKSRNSLPGPIGLPFIGYWPFLKDSDCHLILTNWQKKYGDIYSFRYTGGLYINLGSFKALKEIHLEKADCFERISDFSMSTVFFADSISVVNGEPWKVLRKFSSQQFKELGITSMKGHMGEPMYDSIKETIEHLKSKNGEPVEIVQLLTSKCTTIIYRTLFGENGITKQEIQEIIEYYGKFSSIRTITNQLIIGSIAKYLIFPFKSSYRKALKNHQHLRKILEKVVNDHKLSFDQENPRNFVDAYIKERNMRHSKGDPTAEYFTDKSLVTTLAQLIGDGTFGVAMVLSFFLKWIVEHKDEQEKIYSEIKEVVGRERAPSIEDRNNLSYTNSLILEIMRKSNFLTIFPSQQCIKETTVRGYKIPKGAISLLNVHACHHDPSVYKDPDIFDPTRYIAESGKPRPETPLTFGIGRRTCTGEGFVMTQVFLYITTIIQNFKLIVPDNPEFTTNDLFTIGKMHVCARPRN